MGMNYNSSLRVWIILFLILSNIFTTHCRLDVSIGIGNLVENHDSYNHIQFNLELLRLTKRISLNHKNKISLAKMYLLNLNGSPFQDEKTIHSHLYLKYIITYNLNI